MRTWTKWMSLLLALSMAISLTVPVVSAEENEIVTTAAEEEFVFPEFGDAYSLGEALIGGMTLTEYALLVEKNDKQYLMASAKGGTLYVLKLSEFLNGESASGTYIEAAVSHGIQIPRGIVMDSQGVSYTNGDAGYVFCYDFYHNTTARISTPGVSFSMTIDKNDNLYVGCGQQVIKIELRNNNKQTVLFETKEITYISSMDAGEDGEIYVWAPRAGYSNGSMVYRLNTETGEVITKYVDEKNKSGSYLSYIDGVLFGGDSGSGTDAAVYDAKTLRPLDLGVPAWIMGVVTEPNEDGKSYLQVNANGVFEYDVATKTISRVDGLNAWNTNLRIREPYLEVDYDGVKGKCIVTMAAGHGLPSILGIEGQGFREMDELVEETTSPAEIRSVGKAVAGVKVLHGDADPLRGTPEEAAIYIGAYLSGNVGAYYPDAAEEELRFDPNIFSNGHAQTDSLLVYQDKLYAGCYNGGFLVEYDPVTDTELQIIPNGLKGEYSQARVHGLSAGDDKVFFSTIPADQSWGGCIGWVDLVKFHAGAPIEEYLYVERNVVFEQSVISIVYDEERNLLFGASSIAGGTNSPPTQDQAKMLVYDVDNKKVLGNFSLMNSENPNSDMDFTGNPLPEYIAGIARDPDTGKFWGLVSQTLFSFEYDEKTNALKLHEEYSHGASAKSDYSQGGSLQWFPRPFCFDGKGNFYIFITGENIYRFSTEDPTNPVLISKQIKGRIYSLGNDGNLYIGYGTEIYKIALNRVDIVKGMIDGVEPRFGDQVVLARQCYEHLTDEEKAQLSEEYVEGLDALEGAARIFVQVQADKVAKAIDNIGAVTVSSQGAIAAVRQKYELLDDAAKPLVSNYAEFLKMESEYERISNLSSFGRIEQTVVTFDRALNPRIGDTPLQMTTFDHITGGIWEFALSNSNERAFKYNGGDFLQLSLNAGWIAFRVKIGEPGLYTISLDSKGGINSATNGTLYMFDTTGVKSAHMYDLVNNEVMMKSRTTQNFVCMVDYSVTGVTEQGVWNCEKPGEYLLVLNKLEGGDGGYGRPVSFTFTKRDANVDATVEYAKNRIDAIGKVNKNSESKINEASILYDALTDAQKALIHAPQLEKAKAEFEVIKTEVLVKEQEDKMAATMVKAYIDAIGTVTEKSGPAIQMAREEYDKLSADAKKLVTNKAALEAAEEAYAQFNAGADQGAESDDNMMMYILIGAGVLVLVLIIVIIASKGKKKKVSAEAPAEEAPETTEE